MTETVKRWISLLISNSQEPDESQVDNMLLRSHEIAVSQGARAPQAVQTVNW